MPSPPAPDKSDAAQRLRAHLERVRALRAAASADPRLAADRVAVRAWQAARLERTYPDLLASPRYRPAAAFFLSDLYGPKDFGARDDSIARIVPLLTRLLPAAALDTIALAVELDALSEVLDLALARALRRRQAAGPLAITDASYADAYRVAAPRNDRERQIALTGRIGAALDRLARKPLLGGIVAAMDAPARRTGLGALHDFLARGLAAFRHMRGAAEFLAIVDTRERELNERIYASAAVGRQPGDIGRTD